MKFDPVNYIVGFNYYVNGFKNVEVPFDKLFLSTIEEDFRSFPIDYDEHFRVEVYNNLLDVMCSLVFISSSIIQAIGEFDFNASLLHYFFEVRVVIYKFPFLGFEVLIVCDFFIVTFVAFYEAIPMNGNYYLKILH